MDGPLPNTLKHIISNAEYYGPSLFLLGQCDKSLAVVGRRHCTDSCFCLRPRVASQRRRMSFVQFQAKSSRFFNVCKMTTCQQCERSGLRGATASWLEIAFASHRKHNFVASSASRDSPVVREPTGTVVFLASAAHFFAVVIHDANGGNTCTYKLLISYGIRRRPF